MKSKLIGDWEYLGRDESDGGILLLKCHYCGKLVKRFRGDLAKGVGVFCVECQARRRKEAAEAVATISPDARCGRFVQRKEKGSKTGHTGVYFQPISGTYFANIRRMGETIYLGSFATLDGAIQARKKAKRDILLHREEDRKKMAEKKEAPAKLLAIGVNYEIKLCGECGRSFEGSKMSKYCDDCRIEKHKKSMRESQRKLREKRKTEGV